MRERPVGCALRGRGRTLPRRSTHRRRTRLLSAGVTLFPEFTNELFGASRRHRVRESQRLVSRGFKSPSQLLSAFHRSDCGWPSIPHRVGSCYDGCHPPMSGDSHVLAGLDTVEDLGQPSSRLTCRHLTHAVNVQHRTPTYNLVGMGNPASSPSRWCSRCWLACWLRCCSGYTAATGCSWPARSRCWPRRSSGTGLDQPAMPRTNG